MHMYVHTHTYVVCLCMVHDRNITKLSLKIILVFVDPYIHMHRYSDATTWFVLLLFRTEVHPNICAFQLDIYPA